MTSRTLLRPFLTNSIFIALACSSFCLAEAEDPPAPADARKLIDALCVRCHGPEKPKSGLNLSQLLDSPLPQRDPKRWNRLIEVLQTGEMPPDQEPQPSEAESQLLIAWLEAGRPAIDCNLPPNPGRVTLRRLNRAEYRNTIRDLLLVDFPEVEDFPSDDVGYGFDNIGDVLSLPPLLMEKYLEAAEIIAERAIVAGPRLELVRDDSTNWDGVEGGSPGPEGLGRVLASEGALSFSYQAPNTGRYLLRIQAGGDQAGDQPVRMGVLVNGNPIRTVDVKARPDAPQSYDIELKLKAGTKSIAVAFLNDYYEPEHPDPTKRGDRNLHVVSIQLFSRSQPSTLPPSHRKIFFLNPAADDPRAGTRKILERLASRAFRRPARQEEIDRLEQLVASARKQGDSLERAIQLALQAILVSPHFLFHVELDRNPPQPGANAIFLTQYELASRLSYFLWASMPDDTLFDLARDRKLSNKVILEEQVRRMLKDARSRALVDQFASQWLQIRNLRSSTPDAAQFPTFDESLRQAMSRETELFVEHMIREDRPILDLIDAPYTFLNERLARHYGIPDVQGENFRRVAIKDPRRGGLVTQASILTVTSNPTRTSPVKRGKWILEQILGTPPPPPPPDVPALPDDQKKPLSGTLRERMQQHVANPACSSCHQRLDPLGFGLENYDAVGAWRDREGDAPVDSSGTLPNGESFQGPAGLKQILKARSDQFTRSLAEKLMTYALGRGLQAEDACTIDSILNDVRNDQYRFSRLVLAIVFSDAFQKRRLEGTRP
jgi:hypothetical protein